MALRQLQAYLEDTTIIRVSTLKQYASKDMQFKLEAAASSWTLTLKEIYEEGSYINYLLASPIPLDFDRDYQVYDQDRNATELAYGAIVRTPLFDQLFTYEKMDLGTTYSPEATTFKLWAPISKQVFLLLENQPYPMKRTEKGVWEVTIDGDLDSLRYQFLHQVNGEWITVHDPYALSSEANSGQSYVINPAKLIKPVALNKDIPFSQAIIYEMSVRDFSQQAQAGFKHAGKFLGLTESPVLEGQALGLDYIKNLGVTHIQLMPLYDFGSVDENHPELVYNWGYDPAQYNIPEGSFSSNPHDPYARITELQTAIDAYHKAGIGVNMDVVYNHVYNADTYAFERIVPGYFYRYDQYNQRTAGTFCGNDVASERTMVSRYIQQSLLQWARLYGFDGFRFDLMGIIDIETMNKSVALLKAHNPNTYFYGEGWNMGTGLPSDRLAHQYNAYRMPEISFFNDSYRDTFKKILLHPMRLVEHWEHEKVQNLLAGSRNGHFLTADQSLNYIECHDNATAFDYFHIENPSWTPAQQMRAASFALQLVLISQGTAFIHSGQEFFREKAELDNSYNIPDSINRLDWTRMLEFQEHVEFTRQLIKFRKAHPSLTQAFYQDINSSCDFYWLTEFVLRYTVTADGESIQFIINFSDGDFLYQKEADQTVRFNYPPLEVPIEETFNIAGKSICILTK